MHNLGTSARVYNQLLPSGLIERLQAYQSHLGRFSLSPALTQI